MCRTGTNISQSHLEGDAVKDLPPKSPVLPALLLPLPHLLNTLKTMAIWSSTLSTPILQRQQRKAANAASCPKVERHEEM